MFATNTVVNFSDLYIKNSNEVFKNMIKKHEYERLIA